MKKLLTVCMLTLALAALSSPTKEPRGEIKEEKARFSLPVAVDGARISRHDKDRGLIVLPGSLDSESPGVWIRTDPDLIAGDEVKYQILYLELPLAGRQQRFLAINVIKAENREAEAPPKEQAK
jgi:hypothetical protein